MSLLLLFSDQIAPAASGDVVTSMLVETAPGTWYDATGDLVSGTVTRGKQQELDQYQAGVATVLLDNDDRTFDPTYAASPLSGFILPMKRVQLRNTYNGVTYPMFSGYADRWTQNRVGPHRGTTSLEASDGFKVLERANLPPSAYALEVAVDDPVAWFRLGDAAGPAVIDQIVGAAGTVQGTPPSFAAEGLVSRDNDGAIEFADAATTRLFVEDPRVRMLGAAGFSFEFILSMAAAPASLRTVFNAVGDDPLNSVAANVTAGGQISVVMVYTSSVATGLFTAGGSTVVTDGSPHHVMVTWTGSTSAPRVWIDGSDVTISPTVSGTFALNIKWVTIGNTYAAGSSSPAATLDEFAWYDEELGSARIAAHAGSRSTPWDGDLPGARMERVLNQIGWPDDLRDIDAGTTPLQSATLDMSALEHLQKVTDTEFGDLYVQADGVLRFEARSSGINQPVVATFSDAPGGGLPITFSDPEISGDQIRNDVTVSRNDGVAQTVQDAASITAYLLSSYTRDGLYHDDDQFSRYAAQFILAGYKDPVERVSSMTANPYRDPATLWPVILGLELTDRIVLNETPQNVAPEVSRTLIVEGVTHTFSAKSWEASFNLSENTAATQPYWALGMAGFSELGETTRLFF